jgi:hypothetical protein
MPTTRATGTEPSIRRIRRPCVTFPCNFSNVPRIRRWNAPMKFTSLSIGRRPARGDVYGCPGAKHEAPGCGSDPRRKSRRSTSKRPRTRPGQNPKLHSSPATRICRSDRYFIWRCAGIESGGRYTTGNAGEATRVVRARRAGRSERALKSAARRELGEGREYYTWLRVFRFAWAFNRISVPLSDRVRCVQIR